VNPAAASVHVKAKAKAKAKEGEESNSQSSLISGARNHPVCRRAQGRLGAAWMGWHAPNLDRAEKACGAIEQKRETKQEK